ncbi:Uncharacterised protein [Bordetella pertussis]|nr:Uncharacterised protein [Bordetella pertussis]
MVTISIECMKPAMSGVMKRFCSASSEPETEAYTADTTNALSLAPATSMPTVPAAISEPCSARSARPVGLW